MIGRFGIDDTRIMKFSSMVYLRAMAITSITLTPIIILCLLVGRWGVALSLFGTVALVSLIKTAGFESQYRTIVIIFKQEGIYFNFQGKSSFMILDNISRIVTRRDGTIIIRKGFWSNVNYYFSSRPFGKKAFYIPIMIHDYEKIRDYLLHETQKAQTRRYTIDSNS